MNTQLVLMLYSASVLCMISFDLLVNFIVFNIIASSSPGPALDIISVFCFGLYLNLVNIWVFCVFCLQPTHH